MFSNGTGRGHAIDGQQQTGRSDMIATVLATRSPLVMKRRIVERPAADTGKVQNYGGQSDC